MNVTIKKKIYFYSGVVLSFVWPAMRMKLIKPKLINKDCSGYESKIYRKFYEKSLILVTCISMGCLLTKLPNGTLWDMLIPIFLAALLF
jgi:hypothetical protein